MRAGDLSDGQVGVEIGFAPDGGESTTWLRTTSEHGMVHPWLTSGWRKAGDAVTVTSGSFVTAWDTRRELVTSTDCRCAFVVVTDPGTTAEVRLRDVYTGNATDVVSCPAGVQTDVEYRWRHGLTLGLGPVVVVLEARRTAGSGNVYVYWPSDLTFGRFDGTASGL